MIKSRVWFPGYSPVSPARTAGHEGHRLEGRRAGSQSLGSSASAGTATFSWRSTAAPRTSWMTKSLRLVS